MRNANLTSAKKITIIIKQTAKLVINLSPGQKSLLDEKTLQQSLYQDHRKDETSESLEPNHGKENKTDAIEKSDQIRIVNRTKRKRTEKPKFKIKKLLPEPKTVQIKKHG